LDARQIAESRIAVVELGNTVLHQGGRELSHERTVRQFMNEVDHLSGLKLSLKQNKSGFYLEGETGERTAIGEKGPNALLSPREQEVLCENLGFDSTLLGLTSSAED
jgi:hypothetical protein